MSRLDVYEDLVRHCVEQRSMTHSQVSDYIKLQYGETRGCSEASVRQFCRTHDIKSGSKLRASNDQLTAAVSSAIEQVRCNCGRILQLP